MLVFAAIGVFGAGMLAIAAGIPIKEFGFGNTLILSGVLAWCTSAVMLTLWACARDLKQHLEKPAKPSRAAEPDVAPAAMRAPAPESAAAPQGWPESIPERAPAPPPLPAVPPPAESRAPRRNLLFASNRKRDPALREGAPAAPEMPLATAPSAGPLDQRAPLALEERPAPRRPESALPPRSAASSSSRPPAPIASREPVVPPPAPAPVAVVPPPAPPPMPEPTSPPAEMPPPRDSGARNDSAAATVTVLKSGVVDGMAYWLYSDGSIEAQMPEGMMRFGSIDELRAHLDKRA